MMCRIANRALAFFLFLSLPVAYPKPLVLQVHRREKQVMPEHRRLAYEKHGYRAKLGTGYGTHYTFLEVSGFAQHRELMI